MLSFDNISPEQLQEYATTAIELTTMYGLRLIGAILILVIGWVAANKLSRYVRVLCIRSPHIDQTLSHFFGSLTRYGILTFTIIAVLGQFGVQTASLIAVLGAAGLAIGLSLQGTLSHLASGVLLLLFRPFKIGDYIEVSGHSGTVESLSLFMTELTMPDGVQILIPNGKVWDQAMKNYSYSPNRRIQIILGISYNDDINKAFKAINNTLTNDARILKDPTPFIGVGGLGASSVDITIRCWTKKEDFWDTQFDLHKALKEAMDQAGVEIPFPQRVLHLNEIPTKK